MTDIFDVHLQELAWRQQFLFNAFRALTFNGIKGDYAEFGSCSGATFNLAYLEARKHQHVGRLWAFDSELDEPTGGGDEGSGKAAEFARVCAANGIPSTAYTYVAGFSRQSVEATPATYGPQEIALAYVDCKQYENACFVLRFLLPRLRHGMIIAFDNYNRWSASQLSGERQAMIEMLAGHGTWELVPFMQYGWHGQSFAVEDRRIFDARGAR